MDLHLILARSSGIPGRVGRIQLVINLDIQITLVLVIWFVRQETSDRLALLDRQNLSEIEDCLLPVSVFGVRASRESDRLVACGEVDVEPCDHGMNEVVSLASQLEAFRECQVLRSHGVQIDHEDWTRICDEGLHLHGID